MKLKISILILFLILSINNISCDIGVYELEYDITNINGVLGKSSSSSFSLNSGGGWLINDVVAMSTIDFLECDIEDGYWTGSDETSSFDWMTLYSDAAFTNKIGTGVYGYIKSPSTNSVRVQLHIGTNLDWGVLTGAQKIYIPISSNLEAMSMNAMKNSVNPPSQGAYLFGIYLSYNPVPGSIGGGHWSNHTVRFKYTFTNPYEYTYNNDMGCFNYTLYRNSTFPSKLYINNSNTLIINETSIKSDNFSTYNFELNYPIWNTIVTTENDNTIQIEIDFSSLYVEPDLTQPTLTTDKSYYNTSESITISYTNIDKIYDECYSSFCDEAYQMWIYAIDPIEDIPKYRNWLYSDRRDETFILNTSFLLPQTVYKLVITSGETNIMIESDIFYVYPDDEYLSVSCGVENNCYTYNNADVTIYYKINNNSDIIIKDNDNNIISTYHNIIDSGEILYHIPDDLYHINFYPNWKIYLNNTEYSTSFNKGVTVYWSQFQTPTPTPTYTPSPTPDINISDTIDEFKTETQPIKDLIFGLSEIVIDNPDYNKDNIVDESEINHWFNSLIPICIIFLLVVLYVGLKKKRE